MRMKICATMFAAGAGFLLSLGAAHAQVQVTLEPYVTGLNSPLAMVSPPGDDRKFVVEQWGRIRIVNADGQLEGEPFLDIRDKVITLFPDFDERALFAMAFHPNFAENGKFYVTYATPIVVEAELAKMLWWDHTNVVAEYTVSKDDPDKADRETERRLSALDWPQFNHNGHWIGFGADGMLYLSTGDGGYAQDWGVGHNVTEGNGQDMDSLHGKILRLNVDDPAAEWEIYASGLRNPWRCSFDMADGTTLYCGDVGQNSYEEVDVIAEGDNLGWRRMEGTHCFDYVNPNDHPDSCDTAGLTPPILEYENCTARPADVCKGISVTGGYVYRGSHAEWDGKYIFGDWSKTFAAMDGQIFFGTKGADGTWTMEVATTDMAGKNPYILAFAQDADGEVYALTSITTGPVGSLDTIYKIVPAE
jgi:glucose/arabinose dehydrogenase